MSRPVTWDGQEFPSIAAAARHEGVSYWQMRSWLDLPAIDTHRQHAVTIRGVSYPSMRAAASALRVSTQSVHQARHNGTLDFVGLKKNGVPK